MTPSEKAAWAQRRLAIRHTMMATLRNIEAGRVDAIEFAKLWNFVSTMLMLLAKVPPGAVEAAKKEAEIAALMNNQVEDWDVIDKSELPSA